MNALAKTFQAAKATTLGIANVLEAQPNEYSEERAVIRISSEVSAKFKRVIVEKVAEGWWVARFHKGDGSKVEKDTFRAEDVEGIMTRAVFGYTMGVAAIH